MEDMKTWYTKKRYSIIPNGVELQKIKHDLKKYDTFTFISVGRLEPVKNHQLLVNIFYKLSHINCNLLIVGSGPKYSFLQAAINKFNLDERIQLMGYKDDVGELIAKSHCFLLPSLREGLPLVILESALCKVPIIASSQSISDTLIGKDEGYVIDLTDFEKAMLEVINNYEKARIKAEKFYSKVKQHYNLESCIQSHERLYSKIANE
jgi:glycosyltransferase involved in cell wall biosynthesis